MSMRINTLSSQASISALDEPPTNVVEEDEVTSGLFSLPLIDIFSVYREANNEPWGLSTKVFLMCVSYR